MILVSDNNQRPVNKVNSYVSIKWQDNQKYCFRRNVIGKLSELYHITEAIDVYSKESVNTCVNSFTDILNSAAVPLFYKTVNVNDKIGTTNTKAEWFDAECAAAKSEYKKALHNFYITEAPSCHICDFILFRSHANIDFVNFVNDFESQPNKNVTFDELDSKITKEEITIACKSLRDNKACSIDNILYEYFKVSSDILVDALELLFNYILDTGDFPSYWTRCIIVPIHKKGNTSDPNNYRGISLVSCFAKLFNTILNKRLKEWADTNDKVTDAQFGFKANYSTVDAIFILNHFIQEKIRTKGKLFCCFVELRKAYDLINRNCLWYKLIKDGIDGKMFNMLRSMYKEIKLGVKQY